MCQAFFSIIFNLFFPLTSAPKCASENSSKKDLTNSFKYVSKDFKWTAKRPSEHIHCEHIPEGPLKGD